MAAKQAGHLRAPPRGCWGGAAATGGAPSPEWGASPGAVLDVQAFISSKLDCASSSVQSSLECVWDKPVGASLQVRKSDAGPGSSRAVLNSTGVTHGLDAGFGKCGRQDRTWNLWRAQDGDPHGTSTWLWCDRPSGPLNLLALLTERLFKSGFKEKNR